MAGDNIVVFMTFGDLTEAYLVKGILDDNAIPSFISDENVLLVATPKVRLTLVMDSLI